jgi:hypothetical protein
MHFRLPVVPVFLFGMSLAVAPVVAQDASSSTVDGRLLDILQGARRHHDDHAELKKLESDLRVSADLERNVDARIEEMVVGRCRTARRRPISPEPGSRSPPRTRTSR